MQWYSRSDDSVTWRQAVEVLVVAQPSGGNLVESSRSLRLVALNT